MKMLDVNEVKTILKVSKPKAREDYLFKRMGV